MDKKRYVAPQFTIITVKVAKFLCGSEVMRMSNTEVKDDSEVY